MPEIAHIVRIQAPIDAVFRAVGTAAAIGHWFTEARAELDAVGEPLVLAFPEGEIGFVVTERVENARVVWRCTSRDDRWYDTEIAFELVPDGDATRVRFDHRGWAAVTDFMRSCSMSWAYFLESLRLWLETGRGTPEGVAPPCDASEARA